MEILSPIDRLEEALPLIEAGADEFYCGVVMDNENFGTVRTRIRKGKDNRYNYSDFNIPAFDEFEKLVKLLKKNRKKIFLVLNIPVNQEKMEILKNKVKKIKKLKIDGIIISDSRLVDIFKNTGIKPIATSLLSVLNEEAIRYLSSLGFKRVVFDRQIALGELEMIKKYPEIEFETFVMYSGCRSLEGYCYAKLNFDNKKVPDRSNIYMHHCTRSYGTGKEQTAKNISTGILDKKIIARRLAMPKIACGACAIYQFDKYGVDSLKIVGRSFPTDEKVAAVKFVRRCLDLLDKHKDKKTYYFHTRKLFESTFHKKCNFEECYYPHFLK